MSDTKHDRLIFKIKQELGPDILTALEDPAVVEVALNPDGKLWVERLGQTMAITGQMTAPNAMSLLGSIASSLNTEINVDKPIIEGELILDGSRVEGLIPPLVKSPTFCIRRRASQLFPLSEYEASGMITAEGAQLLRTALRECKNIIIAGGTGSGKTTLGNAILNEITIVEPTQRLVVIEDTVELQCSAENTVMLRTSPAVDMQGLLRATMRLRPDRIIVGEVRGAEALTLLKAWNTGHPGGLATLHANDALAALTRLEQLIAENGAVQLVQQLIAEAVDLIVAIARRSGGRQITQICEVTGFSEGTYQTRQLYTPPLEVVTNVG